jgi:hypothetical protein
MEETKKGLRLKGRILPTQAGNDAYTLAKAGALTGLSIGFSTKKYEIDEKKKVRKLTELELYEVSLVTFPANEKATITNVKSRPDTIRAFEECGARLYNEAILVTSVGSACMRVSKQFSAGRKLAKVHQNVLVFCKGDWKTAARKVEAAL